MLDYLPDMDEMGYQEVKVVQDDDGHNYVIPAESEADFSNWLEMDDWYQDQEAEENRRRFEDYFEEYRTGGAVDTKLYAKVGYEKEF